MWDAASEADGQSADGLDDLRALAKEQPTEFINTMLKLMGENSDDDDEDERSSSPIDV